MSCGTFTKNGITREAFSPTEAVKFKFDGWKPVDDAAEHAGEAPTAPPKTGRGSSAEAWRDYASRLGVTVPDDASRDDIQAAVAAAGHSTE